MAGVDDRHFGRGPPSARAHQQVRDRIDRVLRRRQPDTHQVVAAQRGQTFERQRQMRAALVRRHGVNFIDDDRARARQHRAAGRGAEQDVERLRCGDEDVRRAAAHALALARRRVAGAHPGADLDIRQPTLAQCCADAGERRLQVALDVIGQRLQRRDIDYLRGIAEVARPAPWRIKPSIAARKAASVLPEPVGAAISVWRSGLDRRPGLCLRRRRRFEAGCEPRRNCGMK